MKKSNNTKYIFVCGGVLSGLGKGITTASIGLLLKNKGYKVTAVKIDPYISLDAGTMRPQEHGEVFVTKDGGEIDQDLGNYERFLHEDFTKDHNITTGKVYAQVIDNERHFVYQGRDAEIIPDVIDEIKRRIYKISKGFDFVMVEVGGTVGDIENMPFLIAAREIGREFNSAYVMVTYLPFLRTIGELKTKPTQHAVMALRREGINPDFIVTRAEEPVDEPRLDNVSKRCFLDRDRVFDIPDQDSIYKVPDVLQKQGFVESILEFFNEQGEDHSNMLITEWNKFVHSQSDENVKVVRIGLVGKYVKHGAHAHKDTYISVFEALKHACYPNNVRMEFEMIASDDLTVNNYAEHLQSYDGIVVPQGWGARGMEGKLLAIKYCRENNVPYLGLCYGMQMAVIEFSRNVLGLTDANSEEIAPDTGNPVIHLMEEQKKHMKEGKFGGTIRLGNWPCILVEGTRAKEIYEEAGIATPIQERHRHRYEYNIEYRERLEDAGLKVAGTSPDGLLVEMIEITGHKFFIGTQAHPEYKSRPLQPHPLFVEFVKACTK
ncbi:MAG: CTP synthase [Candidatus Dojkabacteria bacterium]